MNDESTLVQQKNLLSAITHFHASSANVLCIVDITFFFKDRFLDTTKARCKDLILRQCFICVCSQKNILLLFDPKIVFLKSLPVYDDRLKHPLLEFLSSSKLQTQAETAETAHQCFEFILLRSVQLSQYLWRCMQVMFKN